jgi:hypothetical protein
MLTESTDCDLALGFALVRHVQRFTLCRGAGAHCMGRIDVGAICGRVLKPLSSFSRAQ